MRASDHTRLINKFIGLCKDESKWPCPLRDLGYRVQLVEYTIRLRESDIICPDVVAVSKRLLHAIVTDCKSGHEIDPDQDRRYSALHSGDLAPHVTTHDPERLAHDVCYVDNQSNHDFLANHTQLPFITFCKDSVVKHGKFALRELDRKLSSRIPLDPSREPTSYYPFSPTDKVAVIVPHLMRALIRCLAARKTARLKLTDAEFAHQILLAIDPGELIGHRHANALRNKIREVMSMLLETNAKLKDQVLKLETKYSAGTAQAMARTCADIAKQYETQSRITD